MKIVFMGTPVFAVPSLEMLIAEGYSIAAVVTQPDRPQGRKKVLTPTPVKEAAVRHGIPVLQPQRLRSPEAVAELAEYKPDLIVTAAYGQILPKSVLELPALGCLNVHGSLLPAYRGGAPIQRSIINGEAVTGITLMYMAEGLDTGDMIAKSEVAIEDEDTAGSMFEKLSLAGAELLKRELPRLVQGKVKAEAQDEAQATYAPNLSREDEKIDWSRTSREIYNQIRGLVPYSGGFTLWNGDVFKVWAAAKPGAGQWTSNDVDVQTGTVLKLDEQGVVVKTGDGTLTLLTVQPSGKKAMDAAQFMRGTSLTVGTVLT